MFHRLISHAVSARIGPVWCLWSWAPMLGLHSARNSSFYQYRQRPFFYISLIVTSVSIFTSHSRGTQAGFPMDFYRVYPGGVAKKSIFFFLCFDDHLPCPRTSQYRCRKTYMASRRTASVDKVQPAASPALMSSRDTQQMELFSDWLH